MKFYSLIKLVQEKVWKCLDKKALCTCWHLVIVLALLSAGKPLRANSDPDRADSAVVMLQVDELYRQILTYHPVAKQAYLLTEEARQDLRMARGSFDPKVASYMDRKEFKGTEYFTHFNSMLKVPVWLGGVDLMGGFEQNTGALLNDERITDGGNGLAYAGLAIPIGQGLFIDQRRAVLRQSQIFQDIAEAERVKIINKLLLEVAKDYWMWYFTFHQYELLRQGYELALFRFETVKIRVEQGGDLSPLDSIEAKITMQEREIELQTAGIALTNARLILSNHIWGPDEEPLELPENTVPGMNPAFELSDGQLQELYQFAQLNHPELLKVRFKIDQLEVERRLARENLKPIINLKYNFLAQVTDGAPNDFNTAFLQNNYKFGFDFAFPLFLRKERAKLQMTNIKIDGTNLDRINLDRIIMNEITALYNEAKNLEEMLILQATMVENYRTLLAGEMLRFENGESSVFLVNVREGKLIESEIKLYDMRHKYAKSVAELRWAAGMGR